jgi:hypothetical protein
MCLNRGFCIITEYLYLSVIMGWLEVSDGVIGVDHEVGGVNVVPLQDHLKDFWVMNSSFLHEVDYLVLDSN